MIIYMHKQTTAAIPLINYCVYTHDIDISLLQITKTLKLQCNANSINFLCEINLYAKWNWKSPFITLCLKNISLY